LARLLCNFEGSPRKIKIFIIPVFNIQTEKEFEQKALQVFKFQYENLTIYKTYCDLLKVQPEKVFNISDIPFLPITFFKQQAILANNCVAEKIFTSSGTTSNTTSKHYVADLKLYEKSFTTAFNQQYGAIEDYTILALLPSYLESEGSSLVYMADTLIAMSQQPKSGFYLNDLDALAKTIKLLELHKKKTLLLGVSYALLDLIEAHTFKLQHTIIMETGGMKGRRKELIKQALHEKLTKGFGVKTIHSEYGMTELLSQAYSKGLGVFKCPPWMKVLTRDPQDPRALVSGQTGGINVIDLANQYTCSFIATQDLGKIHENGSFEILGRFDTSDIRGCNLMID
jgi:phenylacetate-coenzyme A ligase PaaK-like adenylate-forming protein